MAEEQDRESKTEEPTQKRISDALEKGNIPRSREASMFASLLGILIVVGFFVGPGAGPLAGRMALLLDNPGDFRLESGADAIGLMMAFGMQAGLFLLPMIVVLAVAGFAASFFQNAPRVTTEQIRPKFSRISPAGGWKRIFGSQGQVEFLKSMFKFVAVGAVVAMMLNGERAPVIDSMFTDPAAVPALILSLTVRLVSVVCVTIVVMVAADIVWSRLRWHRDLRMTRQELKDEMKQAQGDPLVRARLRSLARDRARRSMIAAVPKATVVIANPTHFAIALRYDRKEGGAPKVLAKGADLVALRIREIATSHGVPIVEDKPLARALYDAVEVDQMIPPEFYRAVAKILYFLYARQSHAKAV